MGEDFIENLIYDFDESGLDPRYTVVRCSTQEEAKIFLEYLCQKGVWSKSSIRTLNGFWTQYKSKTCYHVSEPRWCRDDWFINLGEGYKVVDFGDIYISGAEEPATHDCAEMGFDEVMYGVT